MTTPSDDLLAKAREAWRHAYAPYSGFHVGAALRSGNGAVFSGANIENASYGLARCAEQSAIQAMASTGERSFTEIVVYTEADQPAPPCGACRQILFEFSNDALVHLVNHTGVTHSFRVGDLLPHAFVLEP